MQPRRPSRTFTEAETRLSGGVQHVDAWPGDRIMTCFGHWTMLSTGHLVFTPARTKRSKGAA